jgi:hypothetical protein
VSLDRALDGVPFSIDKFRCHEAAKILSAYRPGEEMLPWSNAARSAQFAFKTLFISICHQMNWDVLQSALADWMLPEPDRRLPEFANTPAGQIRALLQHYPKQERVRANERAAILRDTAAQLQQLMAPGGAFDRLIEQPRLEGRDGFYDIIGQIAAFRGDPLEKKMRVLAHDLYREGIVPFADPENLRPAVEYHLIRLYLRTGRVFPTHPAVVEELIGEPHPARRRLVMLLRGAVDQAMRETSFFAGVDIATLNYVEWQLGRTICVSELSRTWHSYCLSAPKGDLVHDVRQLVGRGCPYAMGCRALDDRGYEWFNEPQFEKAIY